MIKIEDGILGFIIGDTLGVPFEFKTREEMKKNLAKEMTDMVHIINRKEHGLMIHR